MMAYSYELSEEELSEERDELSEERDQVYAEMEALLDAADSNLFLLGVAAFVCIGLVVIAVVYNSWVLAFAGAAVSLSSSWLFSRWRARFETRYSLLLHEWRRLQVEGSS